jgi:light-regulated signal transduction histidine kinase (bacteriophytochrome)
MRWQQWTDRMVYDGEGKPVEMQAVGRDISDRKQAEEELKAYAAKLEISNRELQDFAYVASHDLQEPLRKIQAFGDRLNSKYGDVLNDKGRDYLARMQNAAARMQTLIQDLLSFSRVTTKAQPYAPVNLKKIATAVVSDLEVRVEELVPR